MGQIEHHHNKYNKKSGYITAEVICLECKTRWIAVYSTDTLLKQLVCPNDHLGYTIKTGQDM